LTSSGFTFASNGEKEFGSEFINEEQPINSIEEKVLCEATLEDDFAEDRVLVVLSNKETMRFKNYSARDFSISSVMKIEEITESSNWNTYPLSNNKQKPIISSGTLSIKIAAQKA
jgi:hypothetical protein